MIGTTLDRRGLVELQAALLAGAGAAEALAVAAGDGALAPVAQQTRLGRPLTELAADVDTGDPAADLLLRALALGERTGGGAADAVDRALDVIDEEAGLRRLITVRTAQAKGTAVILAALPVAVWLLMILLDPATVRFYATPVGALTGLVAIGLALTSWYVMRRLAGGVAAAADAADPLGTHRRAPAVRRGLAAGAVTALMVTVAVGPAAGLAAAVLVASAVARPRAVAGGAVGGTADVIELMAMALGAGMPAPTALAEISRLAPDSARTLLRTAARRTAAGWQVDAALADTPLEPLGATLAAVGRWGAPAVPALRRLARDVRAERRAAAELAAERLQLRLVFPTTLLTLPAFVLGVVPPLLWSTLRG